MTAEITTVAELEGVFGAFPAPMQMKVIDHLDAGALGWLAASPLMFAGFGEGTGIALTAAGGSIGFAEGSANELRVPLDAMDEAGAIREGAPFCSLFLIPGITETLRVNGRVAAVGPDHLRVAVDECYGHCGKALIRSAFWSVEPIGQVPADPAAFVAASRLIALATRGGGDEADLSPKGDPAGCMAELDGDTLWFADRPGNRRVDSFRNIVEQPRVALALLVPGAAQVLRLRGIARLTTDPGARGRFTVGGKTPALAIRVDLDGLELMTSPALSRAALWPARKPDGVDPARLFRDHVKLHKAGGVSGAAMRASLSVPGAVELIRKGLEKDYKDNLY